MGPENTGRAGGGNGAGEGVFDGLGFEFTGNGNDEVVSGHEGRAGEAESVGWDGSEIGKTAVVNLLLATSFVELDDFDGMWILKVRDGGVIEGDVAILTNPHADEVDGTFVHEGRVAGDFGIEVVGFRANAVKFLWGDFGEEMFLLIGPKGCGMAVAESDVFVHVKDGDFAPIDAGFLGELGEGFVL